MAPDVGNVCGCICGDMRHGNTTLLVPSRNGCLDCNTDICARHFPECVVADRFGGAITVHCIDRSAVAPRLAIASLLVVVSFMVLLAASKERCRLSRRLYEFYGSDL
mmetsp:Transcript_30353/g.66447  ORF Transcript_30353/g.66447 Transcript_30353/m.66447 type:complete len:107 (-) Transcript_30353:270-590(-)